MNIKQNTVIRSKWHAGFPRKVADIIEIVIHATAGGGFIKWQETSDENIVKEKIKNAKTPSEKKTWEWELEVLNGWKQAVGLVHYHINRAGEVTELISPENWAYHSTSGIHDKNTIGIELEKLENKNASDITKEQAESLISLIAQLSMMFPYIKTVTSHDRNRKKYSGMEPKPCPGRFDWESFTGALKANPATKSLEVII